MAYILCIKHTSCCPGLGIFIHTYIAQNWFIGAPNHMDLSSRYMRIWRSIPWIRHFPKDSSCSIGPFHYCGSRWPRSYVPKREQKMVRLDGERNSAQYHVSRLTEGDLGSYPGFWRVYLWILLEMGSRIQPHCVPQLISDKSGAKTKVIH